MIVSINKNNSDSYVNLFADAYRFLKDFDEREGTNYLDDTSKDSFSSLAEYYSHMADLFDAHGYQYIMVPLDEEPFTIDLNTRSITVPKSFTACASVQTDLLAETIVFVTDRYFDYMDLSNTDIYVQWVTPDGTKGATKVEMIDLDSEANKIKFAWPLHNIITKNPGEVNFSIRFFRLHEGETVYSLNTLNNKITIKPALQPEGPSIIETPVFDNAFKKAVVNSYYSESGIPQPNPPSFADPGANTTINPTGRADLIEADNNIIDNVKIIGLKDNTVTLYAQAIVTDVGEISYEWYYKPEGSEIAYPCANFPKGENFVTLGTTQDVYIEVTNEDNTFVQEKVPHERYYEMVDENAYRLYTGEFPAEVPLYTRYTSYTVADGDTDIAGTYHVRAYNNVAVGDKVVSSTKFAASRDCFLPGPKDIVVTKKLENGLVLGENGATLTVDTQIDNYNPNMSYEWRWSTENAEEVLDSEFNVDITTTENTYTVSEPGWYSSRILATLNRKVKDTFDAGVCRVTNKPLPPVLPYQENQAEYLNAGETVSFTVTPTIANEFDLNEKLVSDAIHYVWQIRAVDGLTNNAWTTIVDGDKGLQGQGTATLTVNNDLPYSGASFRCLVINELNGMKAVFSHTGAQDAAAIATFGDFKDEVPYIFADDKLYVYSIIKA